MGSHPVMKSSALDESGQFRQRFAISIKLTSCLLVHGLWMCDERRWQQRFCCHFRVHLE